MNKETEPDIISKEFLDSAIRKRKDLLPWWIKIFSWLFLILGGAAMISILPAVLGYTFELAIYGVETQRPLSPAGILVLLVLIYKAVVSWNLIQEKKYSIVLAIVDASAGIIICVLIGIYPLFNPSSHNYSFRLELIFLVPYLVKMIQIKSAWEKYLS
ncbi:MAG TPA: hypothetical protein VFV08_14420 [Puia sp.]|nr:hypothetical protein [Puia sp.]